MLRTKSKSRQAQDKVGSAAAMSGQLRERVAPAVTQAAGTARDWGQPRVEAARDWALPRVERGIEVAGPKLEEAVNVIAPKVEEAVNALVPKVEEAVNSLAPVVDIARDRIVQDILPKVAEAVAAASAATVAAKEEALAKGHVAAERGSAAASVLTGAAVAKPVRHRRSKTKVLLTVGILAAVAAAVAAFLKRSSAQDDPWATPLQDPYVPPPSGLDADATTSAGGTTAGAEAPGPVPAATADGGPTADADEISALDPTADVDTTPENRSSTATTPLDDVDEDLS